jgi:YidC/Oxa1 family membrane protein insertase
MDKQSTIGFVLIAAVLMAWMWYSAPNSNKQELKSKSEMTRDSAHAKPVAVQPSPQKEISAPSLPADAALRDTLGKFFSGAASGTERLLTIETDLYRAVLSTRGGVIREWEMKKYKTWDGHPVQLVPSAEQGDFSLLFNTTDGKLINTRSLFFDGSFRNSQTVTLSGTDEYTVVFELKSGDRKSVV